MMDDKRFDPRYPEDLPDHQPPDPVRAETMSASVREVIENCAAMLTERNGAAPDSPFYRVAKMTVEDCVAPRLSELEAGLREEQIRDGNWLDAWGSCRVCGGEIPHGHSNGCDLFKMEQHISAMETALKDCYHVLVDSGQLEVHVPKSLVAAIEAMRKARA